MHKQISQVHVHPILNKPPNAYGIVPFPLGIDRQGDFDRPSGNRACRQKDGIAHRLITAASTVEQASSEGAVAKDAGLFGE